MHPAPGRAEDARWPRISPFARWVERVVFLSDSAVLIPGTTFRVGFDPILGLLFPGGGDALGGVISLSVVFLALQKRVPSWVVGKMVWNLALDAAVGALPPWGTPSTSLSGPTSGTSTFCGHTSKTCCRRACRSPTGWACRCCSRRL